MTAKIVLPASSEAAAAKALEKLDANAANSDDGWFIWTTDYQKNCPVDDEQSIELARIDKTEKDQFAGNQDRRPSG